MNWIDVRDRLPEEDQAVLFVHDLRQNSQEKFIHKMNNPTPNYVTVRFGYVNEVNVANPHDRDEGNHENWFESRVSPTWWTVTGINGRADLITHWMPLPEQPE